MRHEIFNRSHVWVAVIAAVTSATLLMCARGILGFISFLNPVERALSSFYITDLFYEADRDGVSLDTSAVITIVDMSEVYERGDLAGIIKAIDSLQPAIIGVDIRFDGLRDDTKGNDLLTDAACHTVTPTIWACELENWSDEENQFADIRHSFFVDQGATVEEGFTNVQSDMNGGAVRSYGNWRKAQGSVCYSLPARLAVGMTGDSTVFREVYSTPIRYSSVHFPVVRYDSLADNADLIRNHIVLLGAMRDKRDMHFTPIGFIPGVTIIGLTVNTILNDSAPRELSYGLQILLVLFLLWLADVLYALFRKLMSMNRTLGMISGKGMLDGIFTLSYMALVIVFADYMLFRLTNFYFDTAFVIMSIFLLDTARAIYSTVADRMKIRNKKTELSEQI